MGIEAVGSAMAYQVTPAVSVKPAERAAKAESMEANPQQPQTAVDGQTTVIREASGKQDGNASGGQEQNKNDQLKKAVEQMNKKMQNSEVLFGFHDETNRVMIKIVDRETKEVIKELPPEKTLDMIAKAWELAGILVDEKR